MNQVGPAEAVRLFDHLVRVGKEQGWHREAQRLRCLEVDHQLKFGRLYNRKVRGSDALEDTGKLRRSEHLLDTHVIICKAPTQVVGIPASIAAAEKMLACSFLADGWRERSRKPVRSASD